MLTDDGGSPTQAPSFMTESDLVRPAVMPRHAGEVWCSSPHGPTMNYRVRVRAHYARLDPRGWGRPGGKIGPRLGEALQRFRGDHRWTVLK